MHHTFSGLLLPQLDRAVFCLLLLTCYAHVLGISTLSYLSDLPMGKFEPISDKFWYPSISSEVHRQWAWVQKSTIWNLRSIAITNFRSVTSRVRS